MVQKELTQKEKEKIDTLFKKYQDCEYFKGKCLDSLDKDDIFDVIDENDCYWEYRAKLLEEFDDQEIIDYMKKQDIDISDGIIVDDEDIKGSINNICAAISLHRYLTKEDKKEVLNDYIDFWF